MDIDPIAIIAGVVVAIVLGASIFAFRDRIGKLRMSFLRGAASTRERLSRTVDTRYREAVIQEANSWHVAGHLIPLERIALLPRFHSLADPFNPLEEEPDSSNSPFSLIPFVPDWPQSIAPFQIKGIPIDRVLRGHDNLAILGLPGSGRSATLALMAILAARQNEDDQAGGLLDIARLPILFHVADLDLQPETWGANVDPLQPMLSAAGLRMPGLADQFLHAVQGQFATGYGLILADGWDELIPVAQRKVSTWLSALMSSYPGNKVVVTGPVRGYKPLQDAGLAPTFILPWGQSQVAELTDRWAESWPVIGGNPKLAVAPPDTELIRKAARGNRGRSPLDITLKLWATYAGDDPGEGRRGWYSAYINRISPAPELRPALERLGERDLATPAEIGLSLEEVNAVLDAARATLGQRPSMGNADFLYSITSQSRLMLERINKRLTFVQPIIGAYLAAEGLHNAPYQDSLLDGRLESNSVLTFLAQIQDSTPYVQQRLAARTDVLSDGLLWLAAWAADASPNEGWRGDVFKRLAQLLLSPSQYPLVRERAMAAMVASHDPNVSFIFRQGLKSSDPRVRMLSAFGLGALGDPETVTVLGETLADSDVSVSVAAVLALGAIGTKPAVDFMIQALLTGIELSRRAAAEMFASNLAGDGHDLLKEAIKEQDYMTRRAAVFGLQRVGEDWVKPLLQDAQIHDDQWLVRAAATTVIEEMQTPPDIAPHHRPGPEESEWLARWLADRDSNVSPGSAGISQLVRALQEGDEPTRLAAAEALAALGSAESVTPLYAALRDGHAEVRDAAYRALASASLANDRQMPAVM
jgi:HEAT repeat protein